MKNRLILGVLIFIFLSVSMSFAQFTALPPVKSDNKDESKNTNNNTDNDSNKDGILLKYFPISDTNIKMKMKGVLTIYENNQQTSQSDYSADIILNATTKNNRRFYKSKYSFTKPMTFDFDYSFEFDELGKMFIDKSQYQPNFRDIPMFTDKRVKINDGWTATAYKVLDFTNKEKEYPMLYPVEVFYKYNGITTYRNIDCHYIEFLGNGRL